MTLKLQHGGFTRVSFPVAAAETTVWSAGRVLKLDTSGNIIVHNSSAAGLVGLALKDRTDLTAHGPTTTSTKGTPSGERAEMVIDPAYVLADDQLASGVVFTAGDPVYSTDGGLLTTGTSVNRKIGVATAGAIANAGDSLQFFFNVDY